MHVPFLDLTSLKRCRQRCRIELLSSMYVVGLPTVAVPHVHANGKLKCSCHA